MLQVGQSGARTQVGGNYCSCPNSHDQIWGQTSLYSMVLVCSFSGFKRLGLQVNHHLHLVPRLRMSGVRPHLLYMTSRGPQGQIYLYLSYFILSNLKVKKQIHLYTSLQYIKSVFPQLFFSRTPFSFEK